MIVLNIINNVLYNYLYKYYKNNQTIYYCYIVKNIAHFII